MEKEKLTVNDLWGFAGPIWMLIVGTIFILICAASSAAAFAVIGGLLVAGAIALFVVIGIRNSKINTILMHQQFKAECCQCHKEFEYKGIQVLRHKRWPNGYIDCPHCRAHNGHTLNNLVEVKSFE